MRWFASLLACFLPVAFASVAAADQQRIFAIVRITQGGGWAAQLLEAVVENGRVVGVTERASAPGYVRTGSGGVRIVGGRFVVWQQEVGEFRPVPVFRVFDTQSGSLLTFDSGSDASLAVADPTRARLFISYQNQIAVLTEAGLSVIPNTVGLAARALSADASRLFAVESPPYQNGNKSVVVLDAATGHRLQTIPLPTDVTVAGPIALSEDESRLWIATATPGPPPNLGPSTLRCFVLATGLQELAAPLRDGFAADGLVIDSESQRAAVALSYHPLTEYGRTIGELRFVSTDTGSVVGTSPLEGFSDLHFDRQSRRLLVLSRWEVRFPLSSCGPVVVSAFNGLSGSPVTSSSDSGMCLVAGIASVPAPPQFHIPTVTTDHTVTLSWTPPTEMTTGFVVEAGSAPGLADLASIEVPSGNGISVPNVPSGSYYVRVRSRNGMGVGLPSNERRIDVP